ncbi:MAG: hypothetical protein PUG64_00270 [Bacteroidales bacterium]|nr:hypothetical protein [Bacteroidales bacterium]MDY3911894.1 hypothetical protein [Sodaliphilus sp.]
MKTRLTSSDFDFTFKGRGAYEITYTTPRRGDYWHAYITDMELVDDTLHEDEPTQAAWKRLRARECEQDCTSDNCTPPTAGGPEASRQTSERGRL